MSRKLIIHIGNHKTGSSSIQRTLFNNEVALSRQGFTLFNRSPDGTVKRRGNSSLWIRFPVDEDNMIQGRLKKFLPQALDEAGENVIISAEGFSWIFDRKKIEQFQKGLSNHFSEITVIAYIRRQDMQAVSHHQQGYKRSSAAGRWFYGGGPTALPDYREHFQHYLNYHNRLGHWADCFGERNLKIRVFERDHLKNGDVVEDFFDVSGLEYDTESIRLNESKGFEQTKIGHLICQHSFSQPEWIALTRNLDRTGKLLPSRSQAMAFYAHFAKSNELLNKRFSLSERDSLFEEDFSQYPTDRGDQWTESSANTAIYNLLKGVRNFTLLEEADLEVIEHCAKMLEDTDAESSNRLTAILNRSRHEEKVSPE